MGGDPKTEITRAGADLLNTKSLNTFTLTNLFGILVAWIRHCATMSWMTLTAASIVILGRVRVVAECATVVVATRTASAAAYARRIAIDTLGTVTFADFVVFNLLGL